MILDILISIGTLIILGLLIFNTVYDDPDDCGAVRWLKKKTHLCNHRHLLYSYVGKSALDFNIVNIKCDTCGKLLQTLWIDDADYPDNLLKNNMGWIPLSLDDYLKLIDKNKNK